MSFSRNVAVAFEAKARSQSPTSTTSLPRVHHVAAQNGQEQRLTPFTPMCTLPPKADIGSDGAHVCFVPLGDICSAANSPSI
jgi:hypothetical protein